MSYGISPTSTDPGQFFWTYSEQQIGSMQKGKGMERPHWLDVFLRGNLPTHLYPTFNGQQLKIYQLINPILGSCLPAWLYLDKLFNNSDIWNSKLFWAGQHNPNLSTSYPRIQDLP